MDKNQIYPPKILALQHLDGFGEEWVRNLSSSTTNEEAYEKVEAVFQQYYQRRRYKNFSSFYNAWLARNRVVR